MKSMKMIYASCSFMNSSRSGNRFKVLPYLSVTAAILFLSGCAQYAMKKDVVELQQKTKEAQEANQEINERLSMIEQVPKADLAALASLEERVNRISTYALELERRIQLQSPQQPQPQLQPKMTLGVKAVSVEDLRKLTEKIDELDSRIRNTDVTKEVALNSVSFPLGKVRVEDLSAAELSRLRENASRIREEKPSRVEIVTWADGSGTPDTREKAAGERGKNIEAYYRANGGEGVTIEFLTVSRVASVSGPFWRRAETTMWMTRDVK